MKVYNICIECKMSAEALHEKRMRNEDSRNYLLDSGNDASDSSDNDVFFDPGMEEMISFDTCETSSPDSPNKKVRQQQQQQQESHGVEKMLILQAAAMNPNKNNSRSGARCPVPDAMPLIESGDQVCKLLFTKSKHLHSYSMRIFIQTNALLFVTHSYMHHICKGRCQ